MIIFPIRIHFTADGSRDAELTAIALGLAKATSSELDVVTNAEEYPHYDVYRPLAEGSRQLAQEVFDEQLKRIGNLGGTVDQNYLGTGRAAEEVVGLAEEIGAEPPRPAQYVPSGRACRMCTDTDGELRNP